MRGHAKVLFAVAAPGNEAKMRSSNTPDAPVSKFVLKMKGKKGLLGNSRDICKHTYRATAKITAHSGKTANQRPVLGNSCRGAKRETRQARRPVGASS